MTIAKMSTVTDEGKLPTTERIVKSKWFFGSIAQQDACGINCPLGRIGNEGDLTCWFLLSRGPLIVPIDVET